MAIEESRSQKATREWYENKSGWVKPEEWEIARQRFVNTFTDALSKGKEISASIESSWLDEETDDTISPERQEGLNRLKDAAETLKEIRSTSTTGGQKGRKDEELAYIDPLALMELGKVAAMGARKYESFNYLKGYPWSWSMNALLRHLTAYWSGEDTDSESGLLHTAHIQWHAAALTSFNLREIGTDDRPKV